jgi:hypothetical protein
VPPPSADSAGPRGSADTDGAAADPLADQVAAQRRVVDIRCGFADLASKEANAAEDRVAQARRQHDEQIAVLARAQAALDKTRTAKEEARRAYRASVAAAGERVQVEAAANAWLGTINRINGKIRAAQARIERKAEVSEALLAKLDKLSMTAEASRAMADAAIEACRTFRQALQRLEKGMSNSSPAVDTAPAPPARSKPKPGAAAKPKPAPAASKPTPATAKPAPTAATAKPTPTAATAKPTPTAATAKRASPMLPSPPSPPSPAAASPAATSPAAASPEATSPAAPSPAAPELALSSAALASHAPTQSRLSTDWLGIGLRSPDAQPIMRLLRGHRATLSMLVDGLADLDPASRRHWQLLLSSFVDAVAAAAIEEAFFEFPPGDPFWGLFTPDQAREVARGLAALGFRYDGMGEFADGHVPGQRDLALAVGAAGMLPVRIRFWPSAAETAALFRGVRVATDLLVAQRAPALTLGEMVRLLGRRAEQLTDLWNDWPRVRPVLLTAIIE